MTELLHQDHARDHDRGTDHTPTTRTVVYDLPAPWLLHGLFRSDAYVSHTGGCATVTVALATDEGYATGMVVPTDGQSRNERSFDDYFSGADRPPQDKAAVTFRCDIHDVDAVVPAVHAAAERAHEIRGEQR